MSKNQSLKESVPKYSQKFDCSGNPCETIWHKVEKSSEIGPDFKNLFYNFSCFLTPTVTVKFMGEKNWILGSVSTQT